MIEIQTEPNNFFIRAQAKVKNSSVDVSGGKSKGKTIFVEETDAKINFVHGDKKKTL